MPIVCRTGEAWVLIKDSAPAVELQRLNSHCVAIRRSSMKEEHPLHCLLLTLLEQPFLLVLLHCPTSETRQWDEGPNGEVKRNGDPHGRILG